MESHVKRYDMEHWQALEDLDIASKRFDDKIRYVIRGKAGTEYAGLAHGFGIVDEKSDRVYLYDEKRQAESALEDLAKSLLKNSKEDAYKLFELHEVRKDELHSTYKKA